ncbi:MAG TPA: AMP-binding protein, partial [Ramlibacter sp.]|nr:AMP-binding protein [Ramlibacter sp.]
MHSSAALHGVPPSDACVVRHLLERHLRERPAQLFARFASGAPDWSYADLHREVAAAAHALRRSGVEQGELVLCWLPNGPLAIRTWLALNCLGAIYVPLNPAFQGTILEHTIRLTGA